MILKLRSTSSKRFATQSKRLLLMDDCNLKNVKKKEKSLIRKNYMIWNGVHNNIIL